MHNDEVLTAFVSNFARTASFTFRDSVWNTYPCDKHGSLEMMNFYLSDGIMENQEKNPDNKNYNTVYDGTINLSTVNRADSIGTKGHFYQIDDKLKDRIPVIKDHNGSVITPKVANDETWLGMERYSGVDM